MKPICFGCGAELMPGSRFCADCGLRLAGQVPPQPPFATSHSYTPRHLIERVLTTGHALEGERKRVTVLFCDIANSTTLAERIGEERMHEVLQRFFEHALDVVHHYQGSVNQFLGDGFMALFGAPQALERHEQHALLSGLALRERLHQHFAGATPPDLPLAVRMGLNTGHVVVGAIGDKLRMDYTAVGDTTNLAARLQAMADPGDILAAASTYMPASTMLDAQSLGPVPIRGLAQPVAVYRIKGVRLKSGTGTAGGARHQSTFTGREHEMARLEECLALADQGRGQAVGIVSEPGMGKSRLLAELRRSATARGMQVLEGQCQSFGTSTPLLPVKELVRAACGIAPTDDVTGVRRKVSDTLLALGGDAELQHDSALVLHALGVGDVTEPLQGLVAETIQARTFDILRRLLLGSSQRCTLIIVVEDIHWIDRSSEDFIATLVDRLGGARMLVLATYRPGHSPAWIDKSCTTLIALPPLRPDSALAIARDVLARHSAPPNLAEAVVARAEGNPLFLEELARAIVEQPERALAVPDTLAGVLGARIDRLPEAAKRLLQTASVIGREFSRGLLDKVWSDDAPLDPELARLTRLEFIFERSSQGETQYTFKHALTREAAYAGLLQSRRRALHGAVGLALEQLHAGSAGAPVELLAHQFGLSEFDDKAVDYAISAAARAQERWANNEALAFAEWAQRRLATMPKTDANRLRRIDLVLKQSEARFALGQQAAQLAALAGIESLIMPADEPARRAAWHYWMGFLQSMTGGRPEASIDHCREASAIAHGDQLEDLRACADTCLAQVYVLAGQINPALETGERALAVFERRGNRWWACRALAQLIPATNARGDWRRSQAYCERALAHGVAMNDLRLKVSAHVRRAATEVQRGDWQRALAECEVAETLGPVQFDAAAMRAIRGYSRSLAGQLREGVAELGDALAWYDKASLRYTHTLFSIWLAECHLRASAPQQAQTVLRGTLTLCRDLGYRYLEGSSLRLLAACLQATEPQAAAAHLREALNIATSIGALGELAKAQWLAAALNVEDVVDGADADSLRAHAIVSLRGLGAAETTLVDSSLKLLKTEA